MFNVISIRILEDICRKYSCYCEMHIWEEERKNRKQSGESLFWHQHFSLGHRNQASVVLADGWTHGSPKRREDPDPDHINRPTRTFTKACSQLHREQPFQQMVQNDLDLHSQPMNFLLSLRKLTPRGFKYKMPRLKTFRKEWRRKSPGLSAK